MACSLIHSEDDPNRIAEGVDVDVVDRPGVGAQVPQLLYSPPSIRAKLLLFSLFLVVVPVLLVALIAFISARRVIINAVGLQLAEVAHDTASQVEGTLLRERANVRTWARQDFMREVVIGDADKRISRFLASLKDSGAAYVDLLCADRSGRVVASSNPAFVGADHADREWHRAALRHEEFFAGPVAWSGEHPRTLEIAVPLYDPEEAGRVIGALLGVYDWAGRGTALTKRIQRDMVPFKLLVDVLVLDEEGRVIAESRQGHRVKLGGQNLRAAGWAAAQSPPPSVRPGFVREPRARALVGYARLDEARPGWSALAVQPLEEALAPVYKMQNRLALALVGVLLAACGIAVLLAERMSRPLRELTRATRDIARAAEPRRPVPVRSRDEIGQLAEAFNEMGGALRRAQDDLVAAARLALLGELAAGIAHEVRTPLSILRSSAQLLARSLRSRDREDAELVDMMIGEVDRLDRVVAGLLELASPREPVMEATRLAAVLERALDLVDAQAREKGIAVERVFAADLPPAHCDPEQIYQVALNLIVNALQVLPQGGRITVRTERAANGRVAFAVSDNGPGMPPDVVAHLFTPYFTTRAGGTGLGLALVHRMVQAHHGAVSVETAVGQGATFRVELPVAEGERR